MQKLIQYLLYLTILSLPIHGEPQKQITFQQPSSLVGEVDKKRIRLNFIHADMKRKFKETQFINVEPGCILVEAYVKMISDKKIEISLPNDGGFTSRTMKLLGVDSKKITVVFEPSKKANHASKILAIKPTENKPKKANKSQ
jgi:hypothetical protein